MPRTLEVPLYGTCVALLMQAMVGCAVQPVWTSGFENGFPGGEWLDYTNGSYAADGRLPAGRVAAWTLVNRRSGAPVYAGAHAYKGWIVGAAKDSHRPYPSIHVDIATPFVNTFMVYLDVDYDKLPRDAWIHFGTWGNYDPESQRGLWALHTMAVRNGKLEFAHTEPFHGAYMGPRPQPDFPLRRWVRLTLYAVYAGASGFVQVWQDGVPMLQARVSKLRENPGTRLRTAHWGLYASSNVDHGAQYNDEIRICTLDAALVDLAREPICP